MSPVKDEETNFALGRVGQGAVVGVEEWRLYRAWDGALETTVDQALIRGLGNAFRDSVSGLSTTKRPAFTGTGASNTIEDRIEAAGVLSRPLLRPCDSRRQRHLAGDRP
jgi:hypothetical protein